MSARAKRFPGGPWLLLWALCGVGEAAIAADAAWREPIDAVVAGYRARGVLDGVALAVVEGDRVVLARAYGRCAGRSLAVETPFLIGSTSKPLTAWLIHRLVESGTIALDDRIERFFPEARGRAIGRVSVEALLTHRSGLTRAQGMAVPRFDDGAWLALQPLADGQRRYSNLNYVLLGRIAAAATGQPYAALMQERVFAPAGMAASRADVEPDARCSRRDWFGVGLATHEDIPRPELVPAGFIRSTAVDLAAFLAHEGARLDAMPAERAGWSEGEYAGERVRWHNGSTATYSTSLLRLPDRGIGFVVLADRAPGLLGNPVDRLARDLVRLAAGQPPAPAPWPLERLLMGLVGLATAWAFLRTLRQVRRSRGQRRPLRRGQRLATSLGVLALVVALAAGWPLPLDAFARLRPDLLLVLLVAAATMLLDAWLRPSRQAAGAAS